MLGDTRAARLEEQTRSPKDSFCASQVLTGKTARSNLIGDQAFAALQRRNLFGRRLNRH